VALSRTQIDKLGDRLRAGSTQEQDLRDLDEYRRSFGAAYEHVRGLIRDRLGYAPTGRPAKSTPSIVEKLRRESIRLSQVQDIAGCRIVVLMLSNQDAAVQSLQSVFSKATVDDRRQKPSHGYRAVHLVIDIEGKLIEIQVRTVLQHCGLRYLRVTLTSLTRESSTAEDRSRSFDFLLTSRNE
jgi:ppGpp synthetase/RelA/SpoT-type nucleotidyltranferase